MADISHLQQAYLPLFAKRLDQGWKPYDEYLFEAVERISPALLDDAWLEALRSYFWPSPRSRGRPRKESIGRQELVQKIAGTRRHGPAGRIAKYLLERLQANKPDSIAPDWAAVRKFDDKHFLISLIKILSGELDEMLAQGRPYRHHILGAVDVGPVEPGVTRRETALLATHFVMRTRFNLDPPSIRRMANIASEWQKTRMAFPPQLRTFRPLEPLSKA